MVAAASSLPATFKEVTQSTNALPGYVANVTADAVYVRFLGTVTGRAGLAQLADVFVSEPARHFTAGQSVRAAIVQVRLCFAVPVCGCERCGCVQYGRC